MREIEDLPDRSKMVSRLTRQQVRDPEQSRLAWTPCQWQFRAVLERGIRRLHPAGAVFVFYGGPALSVMVMAAMLKNRVVTASAGVLIPATPERPGCGPVTDAASC